jgi:hypothetical protein
LKIYEEEIDLKEQGVRARAGSQNTMESIRGPYKELQCRYYRVRAKDLKSWKLNTLL